MCNLKQSILQPVSIAMCVHCSLQSINELGLPLRQQLFDHHHQSRSIRRSEATREQISAWTEAHKAQVGRLGDDDKEVEDEGRL